MDERLKNFVERIEKIEEERSELAKDSRDIFAEAKSAGYDVKAMRQVIKLRKMDSADRAESEFLRDEYKKLLNID